MKKLFTKGRKEKKPRKVVAKKGNLFTKLFKNMKIAPRILLGFLVIAVLGTGMGLYNSMTLNQVNEASSFMYKEMLLPLRNMSTVSEQFQHEGVLVRSILLSSNDVMTTAYVSEIKNDESTIDTTLNMVKMLITDPDATAKMDKLNSSISDFNTKLNAALDSIQKGNKDAVTDDLMNAGDLYMATQTVSTALDDFNSALTSKSAAQDTANKTNGATVQMITWILIAAVLFFSVLIGITTSRSISKPVKKLTRAVGLLADGNTDTQVETIDSKNEIGQMGEACGRIFTSIKKLEEDTDMLIGAAAEGRLNMRADAENHKGAYRKIIEGINATLDTVTKPLTEATEVLNEVSRGNLDNRVDGDFVGDYATIKNSLNKTIDKLKELITDTNGMAQAAVEGRLTFRADAEKHEGAYRQIIEGFNATLDAVLLPIGEAVKVLQEVSNGNLDVSVTGDFKGDHAIIQTALNQTVGALKGYINEISRVLGEITQANFTQSIESEFMGNFVQLKSSINNIVDTLNTLMSEISEASVQIAAGTHQLSDGAQTISVGATEQASSIEELTASLTQVTEQTQQNAESSQQSNQMSLAAKQAAAQCSAQMQEMLKSMRDINEASENIFKIIKVIDDIAFQTNILALNAAVEAARAGMHGKGFAVVAEEVRNLAARSASAAKETADLIEGTIKKVSAGTKIANSTAEALTNIVQNVDRTVELGDKIAVASTEQASGIAQINQGLTQVSQVVQNNSATAEQSAAASQELYGQAELLKKKMQQFKLRNGDSISADENMSPDAEFDSDSSKY